MALNKIVVIEQFFMQVTHCDDRFGLAKLGMNLALRDIHLTWAQRWDVCVRLREHLDELQRILEEEKPR